MTTRPGGLVLALALTAAGTVAAGCGGGGSAQSANCIASGPSANCIASGQIPQADLPHGGRDGNENSTSDTIPLAKQDPTTALFSAIGVFQSCLSGKGVTYIGVPNAKDPSSGTNNASYIKSLVTCAAQSKILQALKTEQTAMDDLTPTQVKAENKDYLKWRTCMIARGWGIPEPKPNTKGLLFSFGTESADTSDFKPPPGQNILSSSDPEACAAKAQVESSS